jgi:hypothetical protein
MLGARVVSLKRQTGFEIDVFDIVCIATHISLAKIPKYYEWDSNEEHTENVIPRKSFQSDCMQHGGSTGEYQ